MFKSTTFSWIKVAMVGVAMVALFALAGGPALAQTATVTGTVTHAVSGLPIEGAHVMLRADGMGGGHHEMLGGLGHGGGGHGGGGHGGMGGGHHGENTHMIRVITNAEGVYVMENVPAGDYVMRAVEHDFFPTDLIPVTVIDGATIFQDFELIPR